jgi:hypothetical protein
MLRQLLIGAAFVALGTVSVNAQYQEVVLREVEVPGANFGIVFAMAKPQATTVDRHDPLAIRSIGGELAHAVEGEIEKMFKDVGSSGFPIHAFRVELRGDKPSNALNVYVVPKLGRLVQ